MNRPLEIAAFLEQHGWDQAAAQPFDGDFSPRRYARLTRTDGQAAILMDADFDQKTAAFVTIARLLRERGIKAPDIYAAEADRGLLLLQDFGIRTIGGLIDAGEEPKPFFLNAAAILAKLHAGFERTDSVGLDLPLYNTALFVTQVELFIEAYVPFVKGRDANDEQKRDFRSAWHAVLSPIDALPKSLLLRDFMPDNLMDLGNGELGVLDFQDAGIGPIAYDLASLCETVRRDGMFALLPDSVAHYRQQSGTEVTQADLIRSCTIFSAQRHTRILGIIARLAVTKGRRDKLDFIPRIQHHLTHILAEPYLLPVRRWMEDFEAS